MSFPTDPLDVRLAFAFGAVLSAAPTTWSFTDCTSDLRTSSDQAVAIKVGRSDRARQPEPNNATFSLNNFQGQYSVENWLGAHYPNIVENVPALIGVARNLNPTFEVDASDWQAVNGTVARSTVRAFSGVGSLLLTPTGGLGFASANISVHVPVRPGGAVYVDAWVYSVGGWAGGVRAAVDWQTSGGAFISTGQPLTVSIPAGVWTYVAAYIGPAPSNAAFADGRIIMVGTPANTDLLWIDEARLTVPELCGYVDGWTPTFDDTGNLPTVGVSVSGARRRLGRGTPPVLSPLYRSLSGQAPNAWWPCEDAGGALQIASGLSKGIPLTVSSPVNAATAGAIPGAATGVDFSNASRTARGVTGIASGTASSWEVEATFMWTSTPTGSPTGNLYTAMSWFTSGAATSPTWGFGLVNNLSGTDPTQFTPAFFYFDPTFGTGGGYIFLTPNGGAPFSSLVGGQAYHLRGVATQSGSNIVVDFYVNGIHVWNSTITSATLYKPTSLSINVPVNDSFVYPPTNANAVAGIAMWVPARGGSDTTYQAAAGYPGETAGARFTRLCAENNVPAAAVANSNTLVMGPQQTKALLDLLLDCETLDQGQLFEPFDQFGFGYIAREDLYNRAVDFTIDNGAAQLAPPFAPLHDDLNRLNDVTAVRVGGSSARYIGDTSRGTYATSINFNAFDDTLLMSLAGWMVHLGSPKKRLRHPGLFVDFGNTAATALAAAFAATQGLGIRCQVLNPPAQVPQGVNILVTGYTKTLAFKAWKLGLLGSPYESFEVYQVQTGTGNRSDIPPAEGETTTTAAHNTTDTSIAITSANVRWIDSATYPSEFPIAIEIAGEVMTCTAITGTGLSQTMTVTRNAQPIALPINSVVHLAVTPVNGL